MASLSVDQPPAAPQDEIVGCRGIVIALLIMAPFWVVVIGLLVWG